MMEVIVAWGVRLQEGVPFFLLGLAYVLKILLENFSEHLCAGYWGDAAGFFAFASFARLARSRQAVVAYAYDQT